MASTVAPDQNPTLSSNQSAAAASDAPCVVEVPATLTVVEAVEFEQRVKQCCQLQPAPATIFIDLGQTNFIDSSGLGALVICYRTCQQRGITMVLRGVQEQVRMVLALTDLDQLFTFEPGSEPDPALSSKPEVRLVALTTHPSVASRGKRAMDILGALVGLAITSVLAVPIVIAIKLEDGGPIFFQQVRCSMDG
ncbi:MAG: anti-sigma factor antagonist, partial [Leptolyngbyaceae cyanobacterium SM2_5_2]|nr:anti-sigma factor antagonist [Leptolyngbyaceae cyanobacterium SM2_5_2]